jgi:hypothetical protein
MTNPSKKWLANEPLPKFANIEEEEAFYAEHDFCDQFDQAEEVESNTFPDKKEGF